MNRNVQRINGEVERLHRLTNEQLDNHLMHAFQRLEGAQADVDTILYERHRRMGGFVVQGELDFAFVNDGFASAEDFPTDGLGSN
jgi:hypothetical protein